MNETEIQAIRALLQAPSIRALTKFKEEFNLFSLFDSILVENSYSRFFAYLLDSNQLHGHRDLFFRAWIKAARLPLKLPNGELRVFTTFNWRTPSGRFVDILVEVYRGSADTPYIVIGIENKVVFHAGEQPTQIHDYQQALVQSFPESTTVMVYLTPNRREAETADRSNLECPCYEIGYASIEETCQDFADQSPVGILLGQLATHLQQRFIVGTSMKSKVEAVIKELKQDPETAAALKLLQRYGDTPATVRSLMYEDVLHSVSVDVAPCSIAWHYPSRSSRPREFNFAFGPWIDPGEEQHHGFRLLYMLVSSDQEPDVGSEFQALMMAYRISDPKSQQYTSTTKRLEELKRLSPASIGSERQWSHWFCLWAGGKYRLRDLGQADAAALTSLLKVAYESTEAIRSAVIKSRTNAA